MFRISYFLFCLVLLPDSVFLMCGFHSGSCFNDVSGPSLGLGPVLVTLTYGCSPPLLSLLMILVSILALVLVFVANLFLYLDCFLVQILALIVILISETGYGSIFSLDYNFYSGCSFKAPLQVGLLVSKVSLRCHKSAVTLV